MAARLLLLFAVFWLIQQCCLGCAEAQTLQLSLESLSDLYEEASWDTMGPGDIRYLIIGGYYRYPNFLPSDFERVQRVEEYAHDGSARFVFTVPLSYSLRQEEEKQGVFYVIKPRDFDIPGMEIEIESVDGLAERIREESLRDVWKRTIAAGIVAQKREERRKKGLIHVDIPLPLGPIERLIGSGEETSIDISGRESITFAGESRRVSPFIGVEGQQKQPLFPSLEMKQELDIRLNGQIGEKINVQVDHSSAAFGDDQNKIRLNYRGFDDDIVQLIELGSTSLSLPGFSTSSKGLFGIKAIAQMGPVDLTMIASKQEGKTSQASFTPRGGMIGQVERAYIDDVDFVKNVFFYLDKPPLNTLLLPDEGSIEVFESVHDYEYLQDPELIRYPGRAYVDYQGDGSSIDSARTEIAAGQYGRRHEVREFRQLFPITDYRFVRDPDNSVIAIEMVRPVDDDRVLAVRYVNMRGDVIGDYGKPLEETDTTFLELIKPANPLPSDPFFNYTWDYMMRNIYNLSLSSIDRATLEIDIEDLSNRLDKTIPEGEEVPYIRVFGLDQVDESGAPAPDDRIDIVPWVIDLDRGILLFPSIRPFDPDPNSVQTWTEGDTSFVFPTDYTGLANKDLYTSSLRSEADRQEVHKYVIVVRAASTTRSFAVTAFNIIEGSEVVKLDGRKLIKDRDYEIDYMSGQVELMGEVLDELTPSSNITIDYEYKPFAGSASSSLVGLNALWNISQSSRLGSTWLYESRSSGSVRPRIGEEPTRMVTGNIYGNLQFQPGWLTDLVNLLPRVDTDAPSTLQLSGDMAASFPDPNTRGEVYIDDMEGVEDSDVISLIRRSWYWASPPVDPNGNGIDRLDAAMRHGFLWYNIEPDYGVHRRDLNPQLDEKESSLVTSLDIEFDSTPSDPAYWGGVMTGFGGGGLDLSRSQFIEVWINDFKPSAGARGGVLYVEFGSIDEDFFGPAKNEFNTEDQDRNGWTANEDTGLDGVVGGDDKYSSRRVDGRFTGINGTELNGYLDTEDLDRSGGMEQWDRYFRFAIPLDDSALVDIRRDFPNYSGFNTAGHEFDSWRLYRINLTAAQMVQKDGVPSLEQVRHVRIWMDSLSVVLNPEIRRFQIAGLKIVGNRWEEDGVRDVDGRILPDTIVVQSDFALGTIDTKTEPIKYKPPVRPNEQNEVFEKEQSLLLEYSNLEPNVSFRVKKRFPGRGQDYTSYRDLNFWVHTDVLNDSLEYFFQIAYDTLSFYEIYVPLTAEYFGSGGWMRSVIPLTDLTGLKFLPADSVVYGTTRDIAEPSRRYDVRMVGSPDLSRVRFLFVGLRNRSRGQVFSGEIWVNDIYLGSVKRDIDFSQNFTGTMSLANVIRLGASWQRMGPDFRRLQQKYGSGTLSRSYNLNAQTRLEHFIPTLGFSLPISGSYRKSVAYPKFKPNSDTEIEDKALQDSLRTESTARGFSTTLSRSGSKHPLLKYTFDRIRTNFSMSRAVTRSPSGADTSTSMSGTFNYQMNWAKQRDIRVFKGYKLRYWLNSVTFRMDATRLKGRRYRFTGQKFIRTSYYRGSLNSSGSATYIPFQSLRTSFNMAINRDLAIPHEFFGIDIGREVSRNHSLRAEYKPPPVWIVKAFSPDFSYGAGYNEDSRPRPGEPKGSRNVSMNRTISSKARFDIGSFFKRFFHAVHLEEKQDTGRKAGQEKPPSQAGGTDAKGGENRAAESQPDTTEAKKRDPLVGFRKLGGILSRIRKVNVLVQQTQGCSYVQIPDRPSLTFQMGLTKNSGVISRGASFDKPQTFRKTLLISLDSGTQITQNIDIAMRFSRNFQNVISGRSETESRTTNWPDINLNWKGLERFGLFKRLIASSSANFSFRKTDTKSGRGGTVLSRNQGMTMSPVLTATWMNGLNSAASVVMTKNTTETYTSKREHTTLTVSLDLRKSFTAEKGFRIPLPFMSKRVKFRGRLDSSLNISYSRMGGRSSTIGSEYFQEEPGTSSVRVAPQFTYNFSNSLSGSFFINYNRNYNEASGQTTTTVRVGINVVLQF